MAEHDWLADRFEANRAHLRGVAYRMLGSRSSDTDRARQREVVDAFLAALRGGDFQGLLAVLDPDLVVRGDATAVGPAEVRGAEIWAKSALVAARGARSARPVLVDGTVGVV